MWKNIAATHHHTNVLQKVYPTGVPRLSIN